MVSNFTSRVIAIIDAILRGRVIGYGGKWPRALATVLRPDRWCASSIYRQTSFNLLTLESTIEKAWQRLTNVQIECRDFSATAI